MINKKASAPLIIGGVSISAILLGVFRLWTAGMIVDALEPEMDRALDQIGENIVCPPEFSTKDYQVCVNAIGEIIVNGRPRNNLIVSLNSNKGECLISEKSYNHEKICTLDRIRESNEISLQERSFKTSINSAKFLSYSNNITYLKKPIKTGLIFWRKVRYVAI